MVDNSEYMVKMDPRLKSYPEAIEWYKDANSYPEAAFSLGYFYKNTFKDYNKSIEWYEKSYKMGYKKAAFNLGYLYDDTLKDYNNAIEWYKKGIERENLQAIKNISWLYHKDLKDDIKASAYMITLIEYGETKEYIVLFLKDKWKLSDETIKKGYELQLTMPGLPRRYKGGI